MNILVTGGDGALGWAVQQVFDKHRLFLPSKQELDITDIGNVMDYRSKAIDMILHLAAITDHHAAEINTSLTYLVNHTGTQNMVELADELNIPIVYIGTCGMYDGKLPHYSEHIKPSPVNHYGRSKLYGENCVYNYSKGYVFRSGWGMGGGYRIDKKFVGKIFELIKSGADKIYAINDVFGSPTYFMDFAENMLKGIENKIPYGIYNIGGQRASRYDVAKEFVKFLGVNVDVIPKSYNEYHQRYPLLVQYTKCEVLDTRLAEGHGLVMRDWKEALKEYTERCFK
jgi:dTDP-4-dehydrorhamnose reductase